MQGAQNSPYKRNAFMTAVRNGNIEKVREIINSRNLSASREWSDALDGYLLLLTALKNKHTDVAKVLLLNGSKVNKNNSEPCNTPLHCAVQNGDIEIIRMLLAGGANVNARSMENETVLHIAVEDKKMDIIDILLHHGANVEIGGSMKMTPLHTAVKNNSTEIVKVLLSRGANANAMTCPHFGKDQGKGCTPLHRAVENANEEIIKLLLSSGATVDAKRKDGITSLHIAARAGHLNSAEVLLNHGANVHFTSRNGHTPLYFAIKNGDEQMVKLLLEWGARVDVKDNTDKTILILAVEKKNPIIVKQILKHSPDLNNKSNSSVLNVAVQGNGIAYRKIIEDLFDYGFTVNCKDAKCMYAAIKKGYIQVVEEFLEHGTDINTLPASTSGGSYIPLHVAIKKRHKEVAKFLITNGADVNALDETGRTPIFYAIDSGDFRIFKLLLTSNADINDNPELLNIAVMGDHREIVEVLLQHGADVNASDQYGRTPLHSIVLDKENKRFRFPSKRARIHAKQEVAKLLLSRGANANTRDKDGMPVLHAAIDQGYVKVVEALFEYDADVNATYGGTTPLHISSKQGNKVITEMLLHKGANIHAVNAHGETALHCATRRNHEEVVKLLLHGGADVNAKTEGDLITPLHNAALNGYEEIVKLLLKFDASVDSTEEHGTTALHFASKRGHEKIVTLLLGNGADITVKSKNHYTALDFATDGIKAFCGLNYSSEILNRDYDTRDRNISTYINIAEILKRHMIKMKAVNLNAQNDGSLSIESDDEELNVIDYTIGDAIEMLGVYSKAARKERRLSRSKFHRECDREIASLKSEKVFDTNISFYDILTKDVGRVANYARNECVVKAFKLGDYTEKFPIYASMITSNFKKGKKWRMFLEKGNQIFDLLIKDFRELPRDCTERILSYLKIEDLKALAGEAIA